MRLPNVLLRTDSFLFSRALETHGKVRPVIWRRLSAGKIANALAAVFCLAILVASPRSDVAAAVRNVTAYGAIANDGLNDLTAINSRAATGISMSNAGVEERILFANNTISSSSVWGAQISGGDGNPTVQQLYFYKNTFQGTGGDFPHAGVGLRFNTDQVTAIQNITLDSNTLTNNNGFGLALGSWPGVNNFKNLRVVNNTITNNKELAVTGSFGGALDWQLGGSSCRPRPDFRGRRCN